VSRSPGGRLLGMVLVCLGLFGVAFTVSGLLSPLPRPAVRETCGPGQGSEAAVVAFFDPITIGAGPEPPADQAGNRAQWLAFVHACQSASDQRAAVTFPILFASAGLTAVGGVLLYRRFRRPTEASLDDVVDPWSPPMLEAPAAERSPTVALVSRADAAKGTHEMVGAPNPPSPGITRPGSA
jgi:hypothetical protein